MQEQSNVDVKKEELKRSPQRIPSNSLSQPNVFNADEFSELHTENGVYCTRVEYGYCTCGQTSIAQLNFDSRVHAAGVDGKVFLSYRVVDSSQSQTPKKFVSSSFGT